MTDREKLIEILESAESAFYWNSEDKRFIEKIADHLLANGVTFQKWIPASEPPKEWKDENGDAINYLIYSPEYGVDIGNWIERAKVWFCLGVPFKVTHWMPLPTPPDKE